MRVTLSHFFGTVFAATCLVVFLFEHRWQGRLYECANLFEKDGTTSKTWPALPIFPQISLIGVLALVQILRCVSHTTSTSARILKVDKSTCGREEHQHQGVTTSRGRNEVDHRKNNGYINNQTVDMAVPQQHRNKRINWSAVFVALLWTAHFLASWLTMLAITLWAPEFLQYASAKKHFQDTCGPPASSYYSTSDPAPASSSALSFIVHPGLAVAWYAWFACNYLVIRTIYKTDPFLLQNYLCLCQCVDDVVVVGRAGEEHQRRAQTQTQSNLCSREFFLEEEVQHDVQPSHVQQADVTNRNVKMLTSARTSTEDFNYVAQHQADSHLFGEEQTTARTPAVPVDISSVAAPNSNTNTKC
ncbi:unnamed protein product, partial [Amoebophrya sp. A120]|eukprot:GSA120T00018330001.1